MTTQTSDLPLVSTDPQVPDLGEQELTAETITAEAIAALFEKHGVRPRRGSFATQRRTPGYWGELYSVCAVGALYLEYGVDPLAVEGRRMHRDPDRFTAFLQRFPSTFTYGVVRGFDDGPGADTREMTSAVTLRGRALGAAVANLVFGKDSRKF